MNELRKPTTTTFAQIKEAGACAPSYKRALRKAGGLRKYGRDTPITVHQIVEAMGLDAALWCLRTMPEQNARWRLLAVRYARRAQHLMTDPRSLNVLDVAERHARGLATDDELATARADAWAAWAADAAAWDARAARAAEAAAEAAVYAAVLANAWAADAAAWAAARADAADAAVWAARDAVRADAADAAEAAEREWQAAELIRICEEEL